MRRTSSLVTDCVRGRRLRTALEDEHAKRTDLQLVRGWMIHFCGGPDLAAHSTFNDGLKGRPTSGGERLRLNQEIIIQI
jgi:hypothetical protein